MEVASGCAVSGSERRRLPGNTLVELEVALRLFAEVPVRDWLGSILPDCFVCPECGAREHSCFVADGRRYWQCAQCRAQCTVCSGTLFHATKLPLTKWFQAIYLVTQNKNNISALSLKRHLGVAYSTASDPMGRDRRRAQDRGKSLASSSTLNRLELTPADANGEARYKKIVADQAGLDRLLVERFIDAHATAPQDIWLDLDATDDPLHGNQEGRFFHGNSGHYCYLPLYITSGEHAFCARLRKANADAADGSVEALTPIVTQLRAAWPKVRIVVRGDRGLEREDIMAWCEAEGVDFVLGLAKNQRLDALSLRWRVLAQQAFLDTCEPSRVFGELQYRTRESWSRARRIVAKAEHLAKGANPRYEVTSLSPKEADARTLYEDLFCARGDMENRIPDREQGATAGGVRRPAQHLDHARQSAAPDPLHLRLHAAGGTAQPRAPGHHARARHPRHHPYPAARGRRAGARERPPGRDRALRSLSGAGHLHPGSAQPHRRAGPRRPRLRGFARVHADATPTDASLLPVPRHGANSCPWAVTVRPSPQQVK